MRLPLQFAVPILLSLLVLSTSAQPTMGETPRPVPGLLRLKLRVGSAATPEGVRILLEETLPDHTVTEVSSWINPQLLNSSVDFFFRKPTEESIFRQPAISTLRRIFMVKFSGDENMQSLAATVASIPDVEYAEPVWPHRLTVLPNDNLLNQQSYLSQLHLERAWDIARADATVVIAVIDSGIDPLHPDLTDAIWVNPGENGTDLMGKNRRANGIDDDGNGFVDDWQGYDFAGREGITEDNRPNTTIVHGVHVAGIAAATGNNGEGVAGVGYGARIMPVKVTADTAVIEPDVIRPYEAIFYAAKMGAHIINCSWGSYGYSIAEQEVIDAVTEMGSLVVAAAGNDGWEIPTYPAAYRNVISVGSVNSEDRRSGFSNYHPSVDIVAPGEDVLSTIPVTLGSYGRLSGTSMAAPMVSGAAALILSRYGVGTLTPRQLGAILKSAADDVDDLNPQFRTMLGSGRLNVERSIAVGPNAVYAEVTDYQIADAGKDGYIDAGEEFDLTITLQNILASSDDINMEARLIDPESLEVIDSITFFPILAGGEIAANGNHPFRFRVPEGTPYNQLIPVEIVVRQGERTLSISYTDIVANPSYGTTRTKRLAVTFSGEGRIGFADFPTNKFGEGFRLDGSGTLLAEGGLLIGVNAEHTLSVVRGEESEGQSDGLRTTMPFRVRKEGLEGTEIGTAAFDDAHLEPARQIGLAITLETHADPSPEREGEILLLYTIRNVSGKPLENLHCALFLDWDLGVKGKRNRTQFDPLNRMGYTEDVDDPRQPVVGGMLVSGSSMSFTALNGRKGPLADGFSPSEKWRAISQGIGMEESEIGDNAMIVGSGPLDLAPGDSAVVAFALIAGKDVHDLRNGAEEMRAFYREIGGTPGGPITVIRQAAFVPAQPNPFREETVIRYQLPQEENVQLDIFDVSGRHVATLVNGPQGQGTHEVRFVPPAESYSSLWVARLYTSSTMLAEKLIYLGR